MVSELFSSYLGNFTNVNPLKDGGQKKVYSAFHERYGNVVIKTGTFASNSGLERIKRETDFLKSLDSKYYPKNYDFLVDLSSKEFIIIEEYISARSFTEVRSNFNSEQKVIELLKKIIDALSLLWDKNIVHRDLKPDNILFTQEYLPKIIDLGIARFLGLSSLTQTMAFRGPCTPVYAAPEQLKNQKNLIDLRTDFFAIGIFLLEILYGFHPFHPDNVNNSYSIPENILQGNYLKPTKDMGYSREFCYLITNLLNVPQFKRFRNHFIFTEFINKYW